MDSNIDRTKNLQECKSCMVSVRGLENPSRNSVKALVATFRRLRRLHSATRAFTEFREGFSNPTDLRYS